MLYTKRTGKFEYGAILKGSQTGCSTKKDDFGFEYGAILKGSQTGSANPACASAFEYGAILKGSQTPCFSNKRIL